MKDMSLKQIQRLAEKNRRASEKSFEEEQKKRGTVKSKRDTSRVYVDRSEDPSVQNTSHQQLFREMKKKPYHS